MLALALAALLSAQQLDDQAHDLMQAQKYGAALEKLDAAERMEASPQRLLLIAQCHRELAYASAREAALKLHDADSMTAMAQALDDLRVAPPMPSPQPMPEAAVTPARTQLAVAAVHDAPVEHTRLHWAIATGTASAATLIVATALHLHAASLTGQLLDPAVPDKPGIQGDINASQTASNFLIGAGVALAAVTGTLLFARF